MDGLKNWKHILVVAGDVEKETLVFSFIAHKRCLLGIVCRM